MKSEWYPHIRFYGYYDPIMVGSIDGTDETPHDRAVCRALSSSYHSKSYLSGCDPESTIFVGRIPYFTNADCLRNALSKLLYHRAHSPSRIYSDSSHQEHRRNRSRSPFASDTMETKFEWPKVCIVKDIVTGYPRGYAFACFSSPSDAEYVLRTWTKLICSHNNPKEAKFGLDIPGGEKIILEPALSDILPGWRPRRLGGGLGGRKEAGQLRFGGVARSFRRPFSL